MVCNASHLKRTRQATGFASIDAFNANLGPVGDRPRSSSSGRLQLRQAREQTPKLVWELLFRHIRHRQAQAAAEPFQEIEIIE